MHPGRGLSGQQAWMPTIACLSGKHTGAAWCHRSLARAPISQAYSALAHPEPPSADNEQYTWWSHQTVPRWPVAAAGLRAPGSASRETAVCTAEGGVLWLRAAMMKQEHKCFRNVLGSRRALTGMWW